MIGYLILIIYCLLFAYLTWRHFHLGLALLFFLLPTYLIRFNFGPLPSTLLEVMIWIITIIWLIKYNKNIIYHLSFIIKQNYNYTLFIATALFLLAATISIFTSIDLRAALGEWKAFYFEPILIFVILITTLNKSPADQQEKNQKIRRLEDYNTQSLNLSIFQSFRKPSR